MVITIANIKGGCGKTTTAVGLASALRQKCFKNQDVLFIDADKQQTALRWIENATLPFLSIAKPTNAIHKNINGFDNKYIVIDTPPGDMGILISAMLSADLIIIPIKPTPTDLIQVPETLSLIDDMVITFRPEVKTKVLFNMVRKNTKSFESSKRTLTKQKISYLDNYITQLESAALSFGSAPFDVQLYNKILEEVKVL
jgi:chromosome partitioning protein